MCPAEVSGESAIRLLITSVGSLVGQNLLDVLEHAAFSRRHLLTICGTNSVAASPGNFRCDRCHLVPETAQVGFSTSLGRILREERPHLVLCGRDEDTLVVRDLLDAEPTLGACFPHGSRESLELALDKHVTAGFCRRHDLPYADTWVRGAEDFGRFAARVGYPMIAKPARGFASRGVFYVRDAIQAARLAEREDYLFQEYLGDASVLEHYFETLDLATPLFAHAPHVFHHSAHCFVARDGSVDEIFVSRNAHNAGVTMGFERVEHPVLRELTLRFAHALHDEGGFGPMTVQYRQARSGAWKAMEINLRTNGNTYPRFLLGQDDLADIFDALLPDAGFPRRAEPADVHGVLIGKSVMPRLMSRAAVARLEGSKYFEVRPSRLPGEGA